MGYVILFVILFVLVLIISNLTEKDTLSDLRENWQQFAKSNGLNFEAGKNLTQPIISGDFRGHFLAIYYVPEKTFHGATLPAYTAFALKRNHNVYNLKKRQNDSDIMRRFWAICNIIEFGSQVRVESTFDKIFLKWELIESTHKLQSISDQLVELIEICYEVCKMGGEAVESLLQAEPFKPIIEQIIKAISAETESRIKPKISLLLCKECFTYCSSHKVKYPSVASFFSVKVKYYGCRLCKQSRNFIECARCAAVLDDQMTEEWSVQENKISVNWLAHHKLFDFHEVRIMQASDREVEEFVMQVGNDMDEFRQPRYKEIPCIIASGCKLSANTFNILKHTFKSVKEM